MFTNLTYMNGVGDASNILNRNINLDIPKKTLSNDSLIINNIALSDQELMIDTLDNRVGIYSSYYGDNNGYFEQASNLLFRAKKNSRNSLAANLVGSIPKELNWLAGGITSASFMNNKRNHGVISPGIKVSGADEDVQEIIQGYQFLVRPETPIEIVKIMLSTLKEQRFQDWIYGTGGNFINNQKYKIFSKTKIAKNLRVLLAFNQSLSKSSHTMLYAFADANQRNSTPISGAKSLVHTAGVNRLGQLSALNTVVFKSLTETGLIYENSLVDELGPISGQESVQIIKVASESGKEINGIKGVGIGEPISITLLAAGKLLAIVFGGLTVLNQLIKTLKNQDEEFLFNREIDELNNSANSPAIDDFFINGNDSNNTNVSNSIIPGISNLKLGGAALVLGLIAFNKK